MNQFPYLNGSRGLNGDEQSVDYRQGKVDSRSPKPPKGVPDPTQISPKKDKIVQGSYSFQGEISADGGNRPNSTRANANYSGAGAIRVTNTAHSTQGNSTYMQNNALSGGGSTASTHNTTYKIAGTGAGIGYGAYVPTQTQEGTGGLGILLEPQLQLQLQLQSDSSSYQAYQGQQPTRSRPSAGTGPTAGAGGAGGGENVSNTKQHVVKHRAGAGLPGLLNMQAASSSGAGAGAGAGTISNSSNRSRGTSNSTNKQQQQQQRAMESNLQQNYLEELESHVETLHRHVGAWKIRYYIELTRLNACRAHNRNLTGKLAGADAQAISLSKTIVALQAQLQDGESARLHTSALALGDEKAKAGSGSHHRSHHPHHSHGSGSGKHGGGGGGDSGAAAVEGVEGGAEDAGSAHTVAAAAAFQQEIRTLKANLKKFTHDEHAHSLLVDKVQQLLADKEQVQQTLHEEHFAHSETLALANARQQTISELKSQIKDLHTRLDLAHNEHDSETLESTKIALKHEAEAAKALSVLNLEAQKKITRLEARLEEHDEKTGSIMKRHQDELKAESVMYTAQIAELAAKIKAYESVVNKSGAVGVDGHSKLSAKQMEIIIANQTRKLKDEVAESQNTASQLVAANLDIRLLENEVKSMRVQIKMMDNELKVVKEENLAAGQELTTARVDARTYKDKYNEYKVQVEVLQKQIDEIKRQHHHQQQQQQQPKEASEAAFAARIDDLSAKHREALSEAARRLETAMTKHAAHVEELTASNARSMDDMSARNTAALSVSNQRCDALSTELGHALEFIQQLEQSGTIERYTKAMKRAENAKQGRGGESDDDSNSGSGSGSGSSSGSRSRSGSGSGSEGEGDDNASIFDVHSNSNVASPKPGGSSTANGSSTATTPGGAISSPTHTFGSTYSGSPISKFQIPIGSKSSTAAGKSNNSKNRPNKKLTKNEKLSAMLAQTAESLVRSNEDRLAYIVSGLESKLKEISDTTNTAVEAAAAVAAASGGSNNNNAKPLTRGGRGGKAAAANLSAAAAAGQGKYAAAAAHINAHNLPASSSNSDEPTNYFDVALLSQQVEELWRMFESKSMAVADLESAHYTLTEELSHSVVYARFLEEELFTARKREKDSKMKYVGTSSSGLGQTLTRSDKEAGVVLPKVIPTGGNVGGQTLGDLFGIGPETLSPEESTQKLTSIQLNFGSDFGIDGLQDLIPWTWNPHLSLTAADKDARYSIRDKCAALKAELEMQAAQVSSYVEDILSLPFLAKMKSRAALQEWVLAFMQIYDRRPVEADKLKSPKFTALAEVYTHSQHGLLQAMEALHEPAFFAEQKRLSYEESANGVAQHSGYRPETFPYTMHIDPNLHWLQIESPFAVTEVFPEFWFPMTFVEGIPSVIQNAQGSYLTSQDITAAQKWSEEDKGMMMLQIEESERRLIAQAQENETIIQKMQNDILQLLAEKQNSLQAMHALQSEAEAARKLAGQATQNMADAQSHAMHLSSQQRELQLKREIEMEHMVHQLEDARRSAHGARASSPALPVGGERDIAHRSGIAPVKRSPLPAAEMGGASTSGSSAVSGGGGGGSDSSSTQRREQREQRASSLRVSNGKSGARKSLKSLNLRSGAALNDTDDNDGDGDDDDDGDDDNGSYSGSPKGATAAGNRNGDRSLAPSNRPKPRGPAFQPSRRESAPSVLSANNISAAAAAPAEVLQKGISGSGSSSSSSAVNANAFAQSTVTAAATAPTAPTDYNTRAVANANTQPGSKNIIAQEEFTPVKDTRYSTISNSSNISSVNMSNGGSASVIGAKSDTIPFASPTPSNAAPAAPAAATATAAGGGAASQSGGEFDTGGSPSVSSSGRGLTPNAARLKAAKLRAAKKAEEATE